MVDVGAYRLLHDDQKQVEPEHGEPVFANPEGPGFDDFLLQLPSTIYGFRMYDKAWGKIVEPVCLYWYIC